MNYLDTALLFYIFGPPLLALMFCGLLAWNGNRRTRQLDLEIEQYRARVKAEQAVHDAAKDERRAA